MSRDTVRRIVCIVAIGLLAACGGRGGKGGRTIIQNKGSDTLVNVAQAWAEAYAKIKPDVAVAVTGGGSGTGIAAMINGTVDIANASRKMKQKEIDLAKSKGIDPKEWVVGFDALAVYIHKDNPKKKYTIKELADIYGEGGPVESWSDFGIEVPGCDSAKIVRISRQNNSGTYAYFRKTVLGKNDFKLGSNDLHGSKDVVDAVEKTPCAIGYSGLAYATEHVGLADVAKDANSPYVTPSVTSAVDGSYPIARPLLMYTNGEPKGAVKEYLDWILSEEGQKIIKRKGYAPVIEISGE
ncbi:MAG: PstS family phosphate ABC transporter substrate-binding protein [Planctomycetota bacterium]|nr:PstS family phosphate ABC transporter substrate-binding protein [Planctomycetota bacterium]